MKDQTQIGWWHSCVTDEALSGFFNAAETLYSIKPWQLVPDPGCHIYMMVPSLGTRIQIVSVWGQVPDDSRGLRLFDHVHAYKRFVSITDAAEEGQEPTSIPAHDLLHFEESSDVPESLRHTVANHGWWAADSEAFPTVFYVDSNSAVSPAHLSDVVFFESVARALVTALESPERWLRAWQGGEPVEMTLTVATSEQQQTVLLGSELSPGFDLYTGSDNELLVCVDELDSVQTKGKLDFDLWLKQLERLERSVIWRVADQPDALKLEDPVIGLRLLLDFANYLGKPVTKVDTGELEQLVFDEIPLSVMVGRDKAQPIVSSLQHTYQWMTAHHPVEHGTACLAVLNDDAVRELETRLVDTWHFGPRKRRMIADWSTEFEAEASEALHPNTPEGIDKLMGGFFADSDYATSLIMDDLPAMNLPRRNSQTPVMSPKQIKKRKSNRKAARKARKKNR